MKNVIFRLSKTLQGRSEGRSPPNCIPNPATCAVDSEALRSKVSLRVSPAAPKAQGKRVLSEKIAAGELFRQAERPPQTDFFDTLRYISLFVYFSKFLYWEISCPCRILLKEEEYYIIEVGV